MSKVESFDESSCFLRQNRTDYFYAKASICGITDMYIALMRAYITVTMIEEGLKEKVGRIIKTKLGGRIGFF